MANNYTPMLKVLMTADTVGGVWNYCMELCGALPQVQFYLVTGGAPLQAGQTREVAALSNVILYETGYKLEWMQHPWEDVDASGAWLLQLEKELRPNLVHLNSYAYGALPFEAPRIVVAHSDVFSWFQSARNETPGEEWGTYFNRVREGLLQADVVVGITRASVETMFSVYNLEREYHLIANGRDASHFRSGTKKAQVMTMGRIWDDAKNIRLLLEAAPHIQCVIKVAGDLQFDNNTTDLHHGKVQYLGRLDGTQVAEALAETAVYVLPARYEPFGLSVLEAALSGCALVLGNTDTLRELWQDAALYVDTDDAIGLACAVNELVSHPAFLQQMAAKAGARALQFTTRQMADAYLRLYQRLEETMTSKETF